MASKDDRSANLGQLTPTPNESPSFNRDISAMAPLRCQYQATCAGCDWLDRAYTDQRELKIADLKAHLGQQSFPDLIRFVEIANGGLRSRVDLTLEHSDSLPPRIGLYAREKAGLLDIETCPQLCPELQEWLTLFRRTWFADCKVKIQKGSVRLRVSPKGERGVWLDFANVDIKSLLDEKTTLLKLQEIAFVEMGQRRKRLNVRDDGSLKLIDAELEPWFETYVNGHPVPLFCSVGTFTQPGFKANAALIHEVQKQIEELLSRIGRRPPLRAIEFGSGIGNFTLPLTACFDEVHAFEVDSLALQGLERSLQSEAWKDLKIPESRLHIHRGNFQIKRSGPQKEHVPFAQADLVLVDPPRSGLMSFLDPLLELAKNDLPKAFVYVSCFAESFATDLKRLSALGYRLERLTIVDQFPQSRHYEIIAALRLG